MRRVLLTARAVTCALGASANALWEGLLAGETAVRPCPVLGPHAWAARVPDEMLGPSADLGRDRTLSLVEAAARQIVESPAWASVVPRRLAVCLGTTQGTVQTWEHHQELMSREPSHVPPAPGLLDPLADLARRLGASGPFASPSLACASGTAAIGLGLAWIRRGACDAAVAGGVDALSPMVHAGFSALRALDPGASRPFDRERAGLALGEGAGLVLLQAEDARPSGGVEVAGWGLSTDAHHLTGPDPTGAGLARAIRAALEDAGAQPEEVDFVSAHGTGTPYNDLMEAKALALVFGERAATLPVNSIKGAIGHTMAAAGAIEAALCALVLEHGVVPPTAGLSHLDPDILLDVVAGAPRRGQFRTALSTSSGFGGINAALVFRG